MPSSPYNDYAFTRHIFDSSRKTCIDRSFSSEIILRCNCAIGRSGKDVWHSPLARAHSSLLLGSQDRATLDAVVGSSWTIAICRSVMDLGVSQIGVFSIQQTSRAGFQHFRLRGHGDMRTEHFFISLSGGSYHQASREHAPH